MRTSQLVLGILVGIVGLILTAFVPQPASADEPPKLVYLVSDLRIPFWQIMWKGVNERARELGYQVEVLSADNDAKTELHQTLQVLKEGVDGIIVSPTNSSACVTVLKFASQSGVPVVISDIGTDSGEYVSFIASDNFQGAYELGAILSARMKELGWQDGKVGIISIPQRRANGKARTAGFMKALAEAGIKGAGLRQQVTFSYQETYDFAQALIDANDDLRALWLQGSNRYQGALDAIADAGKQGEILLITFDAEPEFLDLIPKGILVGAGMQQPFLMGEKAVETMHAHLKGQSVPKKQELSVLAISQTNISRELATIRRNVLGELER